MIDIRERLTMLGYGAGFAAVAMLCLSVWWLWDSNQQLKERIAACEHQHTMLLQRVAESNTAIAKWQDASAKQQTRVDQLQQQLAVKATAIANATNQIMAAPSPKTCDAAIQYLIEQGPSHQWTN